MKSIEKNPKKIKKLSKREWFDELLKRGLYITHDAQEGDILYAEDPVESLHKAFKDYHIWKMDVRDFFLKYELDDEANFFLEADEVPMTKGGIEYSYADSPKSQELLKNIRTATSKKLEFLRNFSANKFSIEVKDKKKRVSVIKEVLPEDILWENVTLKMKEGMREVEILYKGKHIKTVDYAELGFFVGKKQQKPDRQWLFLSMLSLLSATDITRATPDNIKHMLTNSIDGNNKSISIEGVHQIKRKLVKRLQELFDTKRDPFNKNVGYYQPIFKVLPEKLLREEDLWGQKSIKSNSNRFKEDFE